jgi:hypothetical protein
MATSSVKGKITRLYPDSGGCYFRINAPAAAPSPKDGYYRLELSHPNYASLYAFLLSCVAWGNEITVRVSKDITASEHAIVVYLVADF